MTPSWSHQTHRLPSEAIWSWGRCWLGGINSRFLAFRILKIDPFSSPVIIRGNDFLFCLASRIWHMFWRHSICLLFSSCGTHFSIFWTFSMACSRMEMAAWETQLFGKHFLRLDIVLVQKSLQLTSSTFLGRFSCFLSLRPKLSSLNRRNQSLHVVSEKHCRHPQAFDAQPISSNWNRKAKLPEFFFSKKTRHDYERKNVCCCMKLLMMCTG